MTAKKNAEMEMQDLENDELKWREGKCANKVFNSNAFPLISRHLVLQDKNEVTDFLLATNIFIVISKPN